MKKNRKQVAVRIVAVILVIVMAAGVFLEESPPYCKLSERGFKSKS